MELYVVLLYFTYGFHVKLTVAVHILDQIQIKASKPNVRKAYNKPSGEMQSKTLAQPNATSQVKSSQVKRLALNSILAIEMDTPIHSD